VHGQRLTVFEWVDGKVARMTDYLHIDAARIAAERLAKELG
jgi:hypothetical protein